VLELREVRARRGGAEVLHGLDLTVEAGEVVGVIGPNGAGKSSLLRVLCGLLPPSAGSVSFDGRDLTGLAPEQITRLGIAMVPEGRQIFASLSVAENLRLGARGPLGEAATAEAMERFPILGERCGQRAGQLSGGEQQQLAIARALVGSPRLLALDEPSMGLAPKAIDSIYELLDGVRREGMTILLVEQNVARTIDFCERSVVMSRGVIRAEGERDELQRDPALLRAYLGRQL